MIKRLKNLFKSKKIESPTKYKGLSDFFMHAPADEQKKVFTEAARKSNEDQLETFRRAQLKAN